MKKKKKKVVGSTNKALLTLEEIQQVLQSIHSTELHLVLHKRNRKWNLSNCQKKNKGGKKIGRVVPKLMKSTIEEIYKTPFCLLGLFGKNINN